MKTAENSQYVDISYTFDFPLEDVFEAWVNPDYLKEWFAPFGCTIRFEKLDIRPGGSFHSCVNNPEFGDCWCVGTYFEIVPNVKIVHSMINADESGNPIDPASIGMDTDWPGETLVTITFAEKGNQTVVNLKQTVSEDLAKRTGAYPGWLQMLDRMKHFITNGL